MISNVRYVILAFMSIILLTSAASSPAIDGEIERFSGLAQQNEEKYFSGLCSLLERQDVKNNDSSRFRILMNFADFLLARGYDHVAKGIVVYALHNCSPTDTLIRAQAMENMGSISSRDGDSIPRRYFIEALALYRQIHNLKGEMTVILNLAVLADRQHKSTEAMRYYKRGIRLAKVSGDVATQSRALCYMSENVGNLAEKKTCLEQALELAIQSDNHQALCLAYFYLSQLAIEQNELNVALSYLEKADKYTESLPVENTMRCEGLYLRSQIHKKMGDYSLSYEEISEYEKLRSQALEKRIKMFGTYQEQADSLLTLSGYNTISSHLQNDGSVTMAWVIAVLALMVVVCSLLLLYNRKKRLNALSKVVLLRGEISDKGKAIKELQRQVTAMSMHYANKNDCLGRIALAIKDSYSNDKKKMPVTLKAIVANINEKSQPPKEGWDKATADALDLLRGLISKDYPDLTADQVNLVVWLRLGFSTRDISDATAKKMETLSISRYRLRKALGLEQNQDLYEFLKKEWPELPYPLSDEQINTDVGGNF